MSSSVDSVNFSEVTAAPLHSSDQASSLDSLPAGITARVVSISGAVAVAKRLMEMGVVPGARIRMIKRAPLGDPVEIRVRGYHLALRRAEANTITIERMKDEG